MLYDQISNCHYASSTYNCKEEKKMTKSINLVDIEYTCNVFFQSFKIPVCFLDTNKNILRKFTSQNLSNPLYTSKEEELYTLYQKGDPYNVPIFRTTQYLEHFILIHIRNDYIVNGTVIIGPATHIHFSDEIIDNMLKDLNSSTSPKKLKNYFLSLPVKDKWFLVNIACLCYNLIYKKRLDTNTFLNKNNSLDEINTNIFNKYSYIPIKKMTESINFNFSLEQRLLVAIKDGDKESCLKYYDAYSQETIKSMSSLNQLRYQKNKGISSITLVAKYAIKGGLPSGIARTLGEMYIQNIEKSKDIKTIDKLLKVALCTFADRVKEHKAQHHSKAITTCQNYIFKNIYQKISVKQLARMVNMNPNYLSILFKEEVGISLNEYIQRERVEEAKKLLTLTDYSLSDICAWLNFSDQSYFTKVFKKFTNKTPGKYRKHFTII